MKQIPCMWKRRTVWLRSTGMILSKMRLRLVSYFCGNLIWSGLWAKIRPQHCSHWQRDSVTVGQGSFGPQDKGQITQNGEAHCSLSLLRSVCRWVVISASGSQLHLFQKKYFSLICISLKKTSRNIHRNRLTRKRSEIWNKACLTYLHQNCHSEVFLVVLLGWSVLWMWMNCFKEICFLLFVKESFAPVARLNHFVSFQNYSVTKPELLPQQTPPHILSSFVCSFGQRSWWLQTTMSDESGLRVWIRRQNVSEPVCTGGCGMQVSLMHGPNAFPKCLPKSETFIQILFSIMLSHTADNLVGGFLSSLSYRMCFQLVLFWS